MNLIEEEKLKRTLQKDTPETGATKFDGEKPMMQLFPLPVMESISKVLTFGAQKYAAHGWKKLPEAVERYQGALLRHLSALQGGEEFDSDSGLPHIWHIGANVTFLIHFYNEDPKKFMEDISC
jgi:hypothetical protein